MDKWTPIFSGDNSQEMWEDINKIKNRRVWEAVYGLGCKLQELESRLKKELQPDLIRIEVDRGKLEKYIRNAMELAKPAIFGDAELEITDKGIESVVTYLQGSDERNNDVPNNNRS